VNSPIGQINQLIRLIPAVRQYQGAEDRGSSSFDHIAMGCIFALLSIIAGMIWKSLFWLYLVMFLYHVLIIEVIMDTFISKKNSREKISTTRIIGSPLGVASQDKVYETKTLVIDWPKVFAQIIERGVFFVIFLPLLIGIIWA
jgi:hypothetical protein